MLAEGAIEVLIKQNAVLPERGLIANRVRHRDLGLHEAAAALDLGAILVGEKGQGAPAGAFRLLADVLVVPAHL
jgi:hypothetical protein